MSQIGVHPRISRRHPEVSEADVMAAMRSMIRYKQRESGEWIAVGTDSRSRLVELVYIYDADDDYFFDDSTERQDAQGTRLGEVIWMNVNDFMAKHGITDADLDRMAAPYEDGSFEPEPDGKVFSGSHLDAVGTRRVTVVYDAKDTQRVAMIARSKGVKPSSVYRDALDYYLAAQA